MSLKYQPFMTDELSAWGLESRVAGIGFVSGEGLGFRGSGSVCENI